MKPLLLLTIGLVLMGAGCAKQDTEQTSQEMTELSLRIDALDERVSNQNQIIQLLYEKDGYVAFNDPIAFRGIELTKDPKAKRWEELRCGREEFAEVPGNINPNSPLFLVCSEMEMDCDEFYKDFYECRKLYAQFLLDSTK